MNFDGSELFSVNFDGSELFYAVFFPLSEAKDRRRPLQRMLFLGVRDRDPPHDHLGEAVQTGAEGRDRCVRRKGLDGPRPRDEDAQRKVRLRPGAVFVVDRRGDKWLQGRLVGNGQEEPDAVRPAVEDSVLPGSLRVDDG